jgi:hypothetical protein
MSSRYWSLQGMLTHAGVNPPLTYGTSQESIRFRWSDRAVADLMTIHDRSPEYALTIWEDLSGWRVKEVCGKRLRSGARQLSCP